MRFRKYKKYLFLALRISLALVLMYLLIADVTFNYEADFAFKDIFTKGLFSFSSFDTLDNPYLNFVKIIILESMFFVSFYESIIMLGDSADGFNKVIKYYSSSRSNYIFKKLKLFTRFYLIDTLVWLAEFSLCIALADKFEVGSLIYVLEYLVIHYLIFMLIAIIIPSSIYSLMLACIVCLLQEIIFKLPLVTIAVVIVLFLGLYKTNLFASYRGDES